MSINLNDEEFDSKDIKIFNNGKAGIAENVTLTVSRRTNEDKENSPLYKLIFTDSNGSTTNTPFWYITEDTQHATIAQQQVKQGKVLKHVIHTIYGKDFQLPPFADRKAMLDGCMKLIKDGLTPNHKFRIFANYGVKTSVRKYIQPRSWVPFMEPMSVDIASTVLVEGDLDAMEQLKETNFTSKEGSTSGSTNGASVDDWD